MKEIHSLIMKTAIFLIILEVKIYNCKLTIDFMVRYKHLCWAESGHVVASSEREYIILIFVLFFILPFSSLLSTLSLPFFFWIFSYVFFNTHTIVYTSIALVLMFIFSVTRPNNLEKNELYKWYWRFAAFKSCWPDLEDRTAVDSVSWFIWEHDVYCGTSQVKQEEKVWDFYIPPSTCCSRSYVTLL